MSAASMRSPSLIADSLNVDMSCSVRMVVCAAPARIVRDDTPRWLGAAYSSELASSKARCDRVAGYAALGHTHAIIVRQELRRVDRLTLTRDGPGSGKVPTLLAVRRKEPVCNRENGRAHV